MSERRLIGLGVDCTDPQPEGESVRPCGYCPGCKRHNVMPVPRYVPPKVKR